VRLHAGDRVRQVVTIEVEPAANPVELPEVGLVSAAIGAPEGATMPPIGLGTASHGKPLLPADLERLGALNIGHLRLPLDVSADGWREKLALAGTEAEELGAPLDVELQTGPGGEGAEAFFGAVAEAGIPLARVVAFPAGKLVTTGPVIAAVAAARDAAESDAVVGGGSRTFFTELNRAAGELPLDAMEFAAFPMNPQVHAIDNASVVETLAAQAATVDSARAIVGARPISAGPVTLKMPFNPNATGPAPELPPGMLPANVDERQPSLFAAAWTAGSIGRLAGAGVDALTYYQTNGWRGVMERTDHPLRVPGFHSWPGMVFPVYHVLADAMEFSGGDILPLLSSDELALDGFAVRSGGRTRVVLANLTNADLTVAAELPEGEAVRSRVLDEANFLRAASEPEAFRAGWAAGVDAPIRLSPYAVVTIDIM
ncbi:MAG: hypothetical protein ACR2J8_09730, partial [Thermomicrobiales bacterium]